MDNVMKDRIPILEKYLEFLRSDNPSWYSCDDPGKQELPNRFSDLLHQDYSSTKRVEIQRSNEYERSLFHKIPTLPSPSQIPIKIEFSPACGRYLVALRDIAAGEVVFQERPLVLAPKAGVGPTCLACLKSFPESWNGCEGCGAPLCSPMCSGNGHSNEECVAVARLGLKESHDTNLIKILNTLLTPIRALLRSQDNTLAGEVVAALQSNMEKRKRLPIGSFIQEHVVGTLCSRMGFDIEPEIIHHICGVFDTNAFEVSVDDCRRGRALFPLGAIMNHSCLPNTQHWYKDGVMVVRAVTDIPAGEAVTNTYTPMLLGNRGRAAHLITTKLFRCTCKRCLDPTELGSHISSVACRRCKSRQGLMVPPLNLGDDWKCQECENIVPGVAVDTMIRAASSNVSHVPTDDVQALEAMLNHLSKLLGYKHYITLELKYAMMNAIMQYPIQDITDENLTKVINITSDLFQVASFIDPGISRFRGILLLEKLRACAERLVRRSKANGLENSYYVSIKQGMEPADQELNFTMSSKEEAAENETKETNHETNSLQTEILLAEAAECEMILQFDLRLGEAHRVTDVFRQFTNNNLS